MASVVDICNLALGHLGDEATVTSIDPPEGSAQAEHCARFYPIARDTVLEAFTWNFATTRKQLAELPSPWSSWAYAYALPADFVRAISVIPPEAPHDYTAAVPQYPWRDSSYPMAPSAVYMPQEYAIETHETTGERVLYTNQPNAVLRYVRRIEDTTRFSPLFTDGVSRLLASYLAGPVIKGTEAIAVARAQFGVYGTILAQAQVSDASQRKVNLRQNVPWIAGR
ncbi:hypothetical protein A7J71_11330 [Achromobacter insolitus]|uniref:hypothetical protein n=1 Tax=Achromobacter insolitus TaxID=217204 RepID=UPI0007C82439|nr:hypothetical protein [Achromobacter insolitus]OAE72604.1 hypothetical protein A7J71_11330 [Achromobacter insolitus]